jgi:hypothetical protein
MIMMMMIIIIIIDDFYDDDDYNDGGHDEDDDDDDDNDFNDVGHDNDVMIIMMMIIGLITYTGSINVPFVSSSYSKHLPIKIFLMFRVEPGEEKTFSICKKHTIARNTTLKNKTFQN